MSRRARGFLAQALAFQDAAREFEARSPAIEMFLLAQAAHMGRFALREIGRAGEKHRVMGRELRKLQDRMERSPELVPGPRTMTVRRFLIEQFLGSVEREIAAQGPEPGLEPA